MVSAFLKRNHVLSIRSPQSTSLTRAMNVNKENVKLFFNNLFEVIDEYTVWPQDIYNCDESGVNTAPSPDKIGLPKKLCKHVGGINSQKRGTLVTIYIVINAIGNSIPPMFMFSRKNFQKHFIVNGPSGCIGTANGSGWVHSDEF